MPTSGLSEADILEIVTVLDAAKLRRKARRAACILLSTPGIVRREEIMDWVYGDNIEPPFYSVVKDMTCEIRGALEGSGFTVQTRWGVGYELVRAVEERAAA